MEREKRYIPVTVRFDAEVKTTPLRGGLTKPYKGLIQPAPKRRWLSLRSSHCGLITWPAP